MSDDATCVRCERAYTLRDGDEPTLHCDRCAHLIVDEQSARIAELEVNGPQVERGVDGDGTPYMGAMREAWDDMREAADAEAKAGDEARRENVKLSARIDALTGALRQLERYFTSGNDIPVERAVIYKTAFDTIVAAALAPADAQTDREGL